MIKLYTANILERTSKVQMDLIKEKFSRIIVNRINSGFSEKHKLRQITTRLMLIKIFKKLNIDSKYLKTLNYNEQGKLMVPNINLFISISYCKNKAICAISKSKIGIDIEDLREKVRNENKILLENFTKTKIESSLDFYKTWTKIESIAKTYEKGGLYKLFTDQNFFKKTRNTNHFLLENNFLVAVSS
jgi:phosphopantetheinyl transferase